MQMWSMVSTIFTDYLYLWKRAGTLSWGCSPQETRDWGWTMFLFQNNNNKKFLEIVSWRPGWSWTCSIAKDHLKFLILSVPPKCRDGSRVPLHSVHAALREEREAPCLHRPGKHPIKYRKATHPAPTRFLLFTQTGLKLEYKWSSRLSISHSCNSGDMPLL